MHVGAVGVDAQNRAAAGNGAGDDLTRRRGDALRLVRAGHNPVGVGKVLPGEDDVAAGNLVGARRGQLTRFGVRADNTRVRSRALAEVDLAVGAEGEVVVLVDAVARQAGDDVGQAAVGVDARDLAVVRGIQLAARAEGNTQQVDIELRAGARRDERRRVVGVDAANGSGDGDAGELDAALSHEDGPVLPHGQGGGRRQARRHHIDDVAVRYLDGAGVWDVGWWCRGDGGRSRDCHRRGDSGRSGDGGLRGGENGDLARHATVIRCPIVAGVEAVDAGRGEDVLVERARRNRAGVPTPVDRRDVVGEASLVDPHDARSGPNSDGIRRVGEIAHFDCHSRG